MIKKTDEAKEFMEKVKEYQDNLNFECSIFQLDNFVSETKDNIMLLNEILKKSNCNEIGDKLHKINSEKARKLGKFLISSEMVYNTQFIDESDAEMLFSLFLSHFDGELQFYTSIDSEDMDLSQSYGMDLITYATFSAGLIIIGYNKCGIILLEGED